MSHSRGDVVYINLLLTEADTPLGAVFQDGWIKKDKSATVIVMIDEPDVDVSCQGDSAMVEIRGLDIDHPIKGEAGEESTKAITL